MKCNVGKTDKIARWVIAVVLAVIAFFTGMKWLYIIAAIAAITAILGFCVVYLPFNFSTCKVEAKAAPKPAKKAAKKKK